MHLTLFTDYALRVLIYAAIKDRPVSLQEISSSYGISRNHLIKATNTLEKNGFVNTKRGVGGGITLAHAPEDINLGDVVRCTEPGFEIVECFSQEKNTCPIAESCALKNILAKATGAFLDELSKYDLSHVIENKDYLLKKLTP